MSVPVWVLLGFAAWTLLMLMGTVGVYRWSLILSRRQAIATFRADVVEGSELYKRAMRAHLNCVENLPVLGAIVLAIEASGTSGPVLDGLAVTVLAARVCHTFVHVAFTQTNRVSAMRFAFFAVQLVCMLAMAGMVAAHAAGSKNPDTGPLAAL